MRIEEIELKNTVNMMISDDYRERFKAEFWQTLIRYRKLSFQLAGWDIAPFIHQSDRKTLERQAELLAGLLYIYMKRAILEQVDLFVGDFSPFLTFKDPLDQLMEKLEKEKRLQEVKKAEEEILGSIDRGKKS